jgi:maleylpyruvate isomerase
MATLEQERAALRERQGPGARYDAAEAPSEELALARLGTAYFARQLNDLPDAALAGPCLVPGWTRAHVVAQVGYQARALTRLTEWAAGGVPQAMYASAEARREEIENGATLPARALRGLFRHAAVHLDVEWRDLPDSAWDALLVGPDGRPLAARGTAWLRAREVWLRAVDLDAGASFLDFPPQLCRRLIEDAVRNGRGPGMTLEITDGSEAPALSGGGPRIRGRAADLARWLTGRGARRLSFDGALPDMPPPDPLN